MPLISNATTVLLLASLGAAVLGLLVVWAVLVGLAAGVEAATTIGAYQAGAGTG